MQDRLQTVMPVLIFARPLRIRSMTLFRVLTRQKGLAKRYRPRNWHSKDWKAHVVHVGRFTWWVVSRRGFGCTLWRYDFDGVQIAMWPQLSWYGDLLMVRKRKAATDVPQAMHLAPVETNVMARCMALVEHCAATQYDDGSPRKPGWFTVKTMGSAWVVEIKDPDTACRLVVVQAALDDALALAQCLLETEDAPWEADPWLAKSNAEKKRK